MVRELIWDLMEALSGAVPRSEGGPGIPYGRKGNRSGHGPRGRRFAPKSRRFTGISVPGVAREAPQEGPARPFEGVITIEPGTRDADAVLQDLYEAGDEDGRMLSARNEVEWERTRRTLRRWLPAPPARLLDIGGASGRYADWLGQIGYDVLVVDLVPKHVDLARARGVRAETGDARALTQADDSADAVLLMGPLYHLPSAEDRSRALAEAARVCRPGGQVVAAAMSRWAKPAVRAARGELGDTEIQRHMEAVLRTGRDADGDDFDQVSYNHDPGEFLAELEAAGLREAEVIGVEGPLGAAAREDTALNAYALRVADAAESLAPHLSIHLLGRGRAPRERGRGD